MPKATAKTDAEQQALIESYRAAESELRREFPDMFDGCDSLSCPPGWYTIVRALCSQVKVACPEMRVDQVKPKAGSLRFYYGVSYHSQTLSLLTNLASRIASQTCETCGNPGHRRDWTVYCDGCVR